MTKRNQLTPDESEILQCFVKQFENDIQVLKNALDEYTEQYKPLVSDNPFNIIRHERTTPNNPYWQTRGV